jgi:hypothetical protein
MLAVLPSEDFNVVQYIRLRKDAIKSKNRLTKFDRDLLPELLQYCQGKIFDIYRKEYPDHLLLKFYNTMCKEAGKDYDLIYAKGDTVKFIENLELCIN